MTSREYVKKLLESPSSFGAGIPMTDENGESIMMDPFNPKKSDKINKAEHYDDQWPLSWDGTKHLTEDEEDDELEGDTKK